MAEGVAVSSSRRTRTGAAGATVAALTGSSLPAAATNASVGPGPSPSKRPLARRSAAGRRGDRAPLPAAKRSFRLPEVVLGVLLVAGCALGAVLWQRSTNSMSTVVVASHPIARGTVIGPGDLRGAEVGGETSALISGDSAHALLGMVALVDIDPNVPLTLSVLTDAQPLRADEALASMALESGEFPPDLAANDHVRVLTTGRPDATGTALTTLLDEGAEVWAVDASDDGVSTIVTVRGSLALATSIAAADEIRLVRVEAH